MNTYIKYVALFISFVNGFYINFPSRIGGGLSRYHNYNRLSHMTSGTSVLSLKAQNNSKAYNIFNDYFYDTNDRFFKPKYIFGLSDFDVKMIRLFIKFVFIYTILEINHNP